MLVQPGGMGKVCNAAVRRPNTFPVLAVAVALLVTGTHYLAGEGTGDQAPESR